MIPIENGTLNNLLHVIIFSIHMAVVVSLVILSLVSRVHIMHFVLLGAGLHFFAILEIPPWPRR